MKKYTICILLAALAAQSTHVLCMHEFFKPTENSYTKFNGDTAPSLPTLEPSITQKAALTAKQRAQQATPRTLTIATTPRLEAKTPIAQPASPSPRSRSTSPTARPRLSTYSHTFVDAPTPADSPIHSESLSSFLGEKSPEGFDMFPEATSAQSSRSRASTQSGDISSLSYSPESLITYENPKVTFNKEGLFEPEKDSVTLDIPAAQPTPSLKDHIENFAKAAKRTLTPQQPKIPLSSLDFQRQYADKKTSEGKENYLYEILGLKPGASHAEVNAQYNKLVKNKSLSYDQQKTLRDAKNILTKGETPKYLLPKDQSNPFLD